MGETPEINGRNPSMQLPYQQKEQRIKSGSKIQTHTLQPRLLTLEHDDDDDCVTVLSPRSSSRSPSQTTKLDVEKEGQEESLQSKADASADMSIKKKKDISGLMKKPIGTKVAYGRSVQYSRGKVGKNPYQCTTEFDLSGPSMQKVPGTYSSLHDKHLKKFFSKPGIRKQLIKQDLITEDGYVVCSQKEFNQYLDYQKSTKPKQGERPLLEMRAPDQESEDMKLIYPVEEEEEEILQIGRVSGTSVEEATQEPSKDDIPAGSMKIKIFLFFKRAWKAVKRAFTRSRSLKISPVS